MKKLGNHDGTHSLTSSQMIAAYTAGYFPMADAEDGTIRWYSPDPRAIIPLDTFVPSRSLHQTLKKTSFECRIDTAFEEVITECGSRTETWISQEIIRSYLELHREGYAHSVEIWSDGTLVGGLYGVALGAAFFGESMFSRVPNASKISLVMLVERLRNRNFELLDTQFVTPHLARLGAIEIPRSRYLLLLQHALISSPEFLDAEAG